MTSSFVWPSEDGWPYPDQEGELIDLDGEIDEDALCVRMPSTHLLDGLDPLERQVVVAHFGLEGHEVRSMSQLRGDLNVSGDELRDALGSGIGKLRRALA